MGARAPQTNVFMKQLLFLFLCALTAQNSKVEIDNPWVHVIRATQAPQAMTEKVDHPATVIVYLTDAREKLTMADGTVHRLRKKAGEVAYFEAGKYSMQNISRMEVRSVIVELKDGSKRGETPRTTLDPVKLDPKHHLVPFENSRVRVLHTILEPHVKSPLHQHPHYVVVYLTELHTTQTLPDGRTIDNPRIAGEVDWRDALQHVTENIGPRRAEEIQIELK
jgi:hypothetical protein